MGMVTKNPLQKSDQSGLEDAPDRVLIASRVLAAVIVPVLVAAFIMLYLFPNDTARLFAWPLKPPLSAMLLGATYLGGAYFFTRVVFTHEWHSVSLGFLPVTCFAGILGIATLLHWDKFSYDHLSFWLWAFLYFSLPFVIPVVWYLNQRANRGRFKTVEKTFAREIRMIIAVIGAIMVAASLVLLISPQWMIGIWPWTLSPLTARVMSAMFMLPGLVGLGVAADGRWSSAAIIFQAQGLSILLFLVAILLTSDEIQWDRWGSWIFLASLLIVLLLIGWAALQVGNPVAGSGVRSRGQSDD
jgi:hypothetical protein